jgi:hypothetical protein
MLDERLPFMELQDNVAVVSMFTSVFHQYPNSTLCFRVIGLGSMLDDSRSVLVSDGDLLTSRNPHT